MLELRLTPQPILDQLKKNGVTHVVWLPDSETNFMYEQLLTEPQLDLVPVCREGETVAIAAGLWVGGKRPVVLIQNTGFFEAGDGFRGTAYNMQIPLVMLIGYRGYKTMEPGALRVDTAATFFEPTLTAWNIPYSILHTDDDLEQISAAFQRAAETSLPAAVLMPEETV